MENDVTLIITNFRNSSSKIFRSVYSDFKTKVGNLDRQMDENVFQQLQSRYINELEKQLSRLAEEMIGGYRGHSAISLLQRELTSNISYNISEFLLKARSM